jgi:hypothetical protein
MGYSFYQTGFFPRSLITMGSASTQENNRERSQGNAFVMLHIHTPGDFQRQRRKYIQVSQKERQQLTPKGHVILHLCQDFL